MIYLYINQIDLYNYYFMFIFYFDIFFSPSYPYFLHIYFICFPYYLNFIKAKKPMEAKKPKEAKKPTNGKKPTKAKKPIEARKTRQINSKKKTSKKNTPSHGKCGGRASAAGSGNDRKVSPHRQVNLYFARSLRHGPGLDTKWRSSRSVPTT